MSISCSSNETAVKRKKSANFCNEPFAGEKSLLTNKLNYTKNMMKFIAGFALISATIYQLCVAGPVEVSKSSDDDMKTSETFGYGYYQPGLYPSPPLAPVGGIAAAPLNVAATYPVAAPIATTSIATSSSLGHSRSGYGYGSGYKYGGGFGYGNRWGYGSGGSTNEFYRRHPVYVAWG